MNTLRTYFRREKYSMMQIFFLMLSKSVIVLKKVITGSLKSKPDRRAPMVEYRSITPWMMFTSARLLKDHVYACPADASLGRAF